MNRDLVSRPYGRFYYLPKLLSDMGHEVWLHLLSYKNEPPIDTIENGLHISSSSLYKPTSYVKHAKAACSQTNFDYIAGISDTYFGILAVWLGKKFGSRTLIDAYDNYESYIPWMKPLHWLWRRSLARADLVTAAGPGLADVMNKNRSGKPTIVVPMSADPQFSSSLNKIDCRNKLNLPGGKILVGYCGGIHNNRGIKQLFQAFEIIHNTKPDFEFILSGRLFPDIELPDYIKWLGYIDDELLPCLIRSLDVLVSVNLESAFGTYSYPVKIYEAMRSNTPVVASATAATKWILSDYQELLAPPDNSQLLADKILQATAISNIDYHYSGSWEQQATILEQNMLELMVSED